MTQAEYNYEKAKAELQFIIDLVNKNYELLEEIEELRAIINKAGE
jgi:hypothetical protein